MCSTTNSVQPYSSVMTMYMQYVWRQGENTFRGSKLRFPKLSYMSHAPVLSWSLTGHMHYSSPGLLLVIFIAPLLVSYMSHALLFSSSLTGHIPCSSFDLLQVTSTAPLLDSFGYCPGLLQQGRIQDFGMGGS